MIELWKACKPLYNVYWIPIFFPQKVLALCSGSSLPPPSKFCDCPWATTPGFRYTCYVCISDKLLMVSLDFPICLVFCNYIAIIQFIFISFCLIKLIKNTWQRHLILSVDMCNCVIILCDFFHLPRRHLYFFDMGFHHIGQSGWPGTWCIAHADLRLLMSLLFLPLWPWDYKYVPPLLTLTLFLEIKFRCSYSCSKHLINQTSSLALS